MESMSRRQLLGALGAVPAALMGAAAGNTKDLSRCSNCGAPRTRKYIVQAAGVSEQDLEVLRDHVEECFRDPSYALVTNCEMEWNLTFICEHCGVTEVVPRGKVG